MYFDFKMNKLCYAIFYIVLIHLFVITLELIYRQWCYPMNTFVDMFFMSLITRNSSVCVSLKQSIKLIDDLLHDYILHLIFLTSSMVVNIKR